MDVGKRRMPRKEAVPKSGMNKATEAAEWQQQRPKKAKKPLSGSRGEEKEAEQKSGSGVENESAVLYHARMMYGGGGGRFAKSWFVGTGFL